MANEQTAVAKGWRRVVYIILGFVFVGLAALGVGLVVLVALAAVGLVVVLRLPVVRESGIAPDHPTGEKG